MPRTARCTLVALAATLGLACHDRAAEPAPAPSAAAQPGPRVETHRITERDHRHVIPMRRGDRIAPPDDPAFDWRVDLEDSSGFDAVRDADTGPGVYALTKAGPFRIMVHGDPKCLKAEGGCGVSKRRWDVTLDVR